MIKPNDLVKYKHVEGNQKNVYLVGDTEGDFMFIRKVRKDGQDIKNYGSIWVGALIRNFVKIGERTEVVNG